ncbi:rab11 family-interacting protein 3 isoform X2 [Eleutherodactylus coqui]
MKMEGDPHVTAWGVMRGQALDLITPQQVVGGLFLMNAEEKACIALQPRLEILDEQGELMSAPHPLLSQHDESFLGAGEGQQLGAGCCQSRSVTAEPWTGEEDGRLTLCTLNLLPPDSAQNPPSLIYKPSMDDQIPPLIIVPSENAHLPLCPSPFSQESEHNLEVNIPHSDPLSADYFLDVHSLLLPDQDACSDSLASAFDSRLIPVPMNSLSSDLEQILQFTSNGHQGSEVPLANDQITPLESCLPPKTDQPSFVGPLLDHDIELLPQCNGNLYLPQLEPGLEQLPVSETLVDVRNTETEQLPQPEFQLAAVFDQLPQSESLQLPHYTPCLAPNPNLLPCSETYVEPDTKHLPLAHIVQINSCLVLDELPQTELNLDPDQLPSSRSIVHREESADPFLDPDANQLPQYDSQLDINPHQLPLSEFSVVTKEMAQSISHLDPDVEKVAESEPNFDPVTDYLPQSEIESCLAPDHDLPHPSETSVDCCVDTVEPESLPSPDISLTSGVLAHSISSLEPSTSPLSLCEKFFNHEDLLHSQSLRDCEADTLAYLCPEIPQTKSLLDTNELFECELNPPIDKSHDCLDSDIEIFNLAESFIAHDAEQSIESLSSFDLSTDQLTQPELFLDSNQPTLNPDSIHLQELPYPESNEVPSGDPLPHFDLFLNIDQISNSESILDHDPDQLPWFGHSLCSNTALLPFSTHNVSEGESSMAHEADELSLCDPFLAPDHYELFVSKSTTSIADQLTLGDTSGDRQPYTCVPPTDMDHKPDTQHVIQSESILDLDSDPLTESCLENDQLPKVENVLDSDYVPVPAPSGTLDVEQLPGLESDSVNSSDQLQLYVSCADPFTDQLLLVKSCAEMNGRPEFESCVTTDDDLFFLSETFLAHEMDQISVLHDSMTPENNQLPLSEPCLKLEDDHTEPCRLHDHDQLHQPETCLSEHNDQLTLPHNDQLTVSECPLIPHNDLLPKSYSDPSMNPLTASCMYTKSTLLQCESLLSLDDQLAQSKPCLNANDDLLTELEPCLRTDIDQLPQVESCLCQENEQLPHFEPNLGPGDDSLSSSDACLGSDNDLTSHFECPLYFSSDQLPQTEPHLGQKITIGDHLETHLDLEGNEVSHCESHCERSHSVPYTDPMSQYGEFPLPECLQAPNTTESNVYESNGTPDQNHLAPFCPSTDVLSLAHNPDPFYSIESTLVKSHLTQDIDKLPLSKSFVTPSLDMPPVTDPTGEILFPKSSLSSSIDDSELLESSVPPNNTQSLLLEPSEPHSTVHLSLFEQLNFSEPSESPTTPHFPPSEPPGTLNSTNVSLCDSTVMLSALSNTNLPSSTPEEFEFPWDWTLNLHPVNLSEVSLCDEPQQTSTKQYNEPEDCFSIFGLDTPPDSSHVISEPELALSDDLLSLCDVFSHLQTNDIKYSQSDQSPISTNDQTDYQIVGDQFLNANFQKELESDPPSKPYTLHNVSLPFDHDLLNSESDPLDSYCLDLLFEHSREHNEVERFANEPLQPNPGASTESVLNSTNSTNPSWLYSESQMCRDGSPFMEKSLTINNSDESLLSDSPLMSNQLCQSSSPLVTDICSSSFEPLSESTQLPMIVVTDSVELLNDSVDQTDNILATNALPSDISTSMELETDAHLEVVEVPSCDVEDLPEFKPDMSEVNQLPTECPDSSDLSLCDDPALPHQPQSDSILGTTLPSFLSTGELPLTCTGSPFEGIKLRSRDSQDSTSALMPFADGDPLLAFSLDNDSSCAGDELARLRAVFDALDRDKDGFVKMEDFVQFATVYGAEQVKYLTGYLDPAGLGVINFRDFYRGISEIQSEDLDMQLYDMGYPSEEEPACSVDFDDLAAFEVTEVTDSAYVGSESAYSECETFTDEDTGGLAAQEDPETEGDGAGSRGHAPATPEGLELSLCDISGVAVTGQEEQFEDFGEGAEPDLFNSHCEEEQESFTQTTNASQRLPSSPDKRTSSRKEARRLHHTGFLEDQGEQPLTNMSCDDTDLIDKVLYLEQRVSELERDAAMTGEQQNRLRQENLHLLHRAHALEEQLKDQEVRSDEVQSEETRKHRDELRKMERDRGFRLSSLKARLQELENENVELRSQLPSAKAATQRLEEEKHKLLDQVEELQRQLKDHQEQNKKLGGKLSKEKHKQQSEKERCQEVIEELRRELEQTQLLRLEMEQRMGLGNSAALQEYNSRTREAELEHEVRRLKQEQRLLKEQNEELNGQIINLSIQGAKNLFSTTFSDSLAAEISSVSRDELMEAIQKQEEINLRLQDYIDRIIVAIMETNPAILEVKIH